MRIVRRKSPRTTNYRNLTQIPVNLARYRQAYRIPLWTSLIRRKPGLQTTDELAIGSHVNQAPRPILVIHGILIGLAHEANAALGLDQVIDFQRETVRLHVVALNSANILVAAPHHFFFLFPLPTGQHIGRNRYGRKHQQGQQKHHDEQGVPPLAEASRAVCEWFAHAEGPGTASSALELRAPVLVSSYSILSFPICTMRM